MGDVTLLQYALVGATAFAASIIGGLTGYGTGLLLPLVLVPIVGPEPVVPIVSLSALLTNGSRAWAFREALDRRSVLIVTAWALPTCMIGAYGYTRLSGPGVALLLGAVLIAIVPARRLIKGATGFLTPGRLAAAGTGYGLLVGATSGVGVILISMLVAAGLKGPAVIATDAGISLLIGLAKVGVFQSFGALPLSSWVMALVIGFFSVPAAFIAKRLAARLTLDQHTALLDAVVLIGGALLLIQGLRGS